MPPQVLLKVCMAVSEEKLTLVHDVTYHEAQTMSIDHVFVRWFC